MSVIEVEWIFVVTILQFCFKREILTIFFSLSVVFLSGINLSLASGALAGRLKSIWMQSRELAFLKCCIIGICSALVHTRCVPLDAYLISLMINDNCH